MQTAALLLFEQQNLYGGMGNRRQNLSSSSQLQVSYDYDEADQLIGERKSGGDAYSIRYSYDETGNRLTKLEDGWLTIYDYDANNRLMSVPPPLFVPLNSSSSSSGSSSSAGSSSSSSSSSGDASTSSSSSSSSSSTQYALLLRYWYDDNGNLLRQQQGADEVLYHWDTHDKLIGVEYADGTSQSFVYSDDGLRKRVVERDGRILDMVWDDMNLLGIVDASSGTLQARFTHADEGYGGLVSQRSPQGSRFYGFDQSTNTRLLSDPSGDVSDRYSYSAFGTQRQVLGQSFNPHRFGGQAGYFQDEDGRAYVRARYLDTGAGRWLNTDPIGFQSGDFNLYRYAANNPLSYVDPSGLAPAPGEKGPYGPNAHRAGSCPGDDPVILAKVKACSGEKMSCDPNKDVSFKRLLKSKNKVAICKEIDRRIGLRLLCFAAREAVTAKCYGGIPNPRHENEENILIAGTVNCVKLLATQGCAKTTRRIPQPHPVRVPVPGTEVDADRIQKIVEALIAAGVAFAAILAWLISLRQGRWTPPPFPVPA